MKSNLVKDLIRGEETIGLYYFEANKSKIASDVDDRYIVPDDENIFIESHDGDFDPEAMGISIPKKEVMKIKKDFHKTKALEKEYHIVCDIYIGYDEGYDDACCKKTLTINVYNKQRYYMEDGYYEQCDDPENDEVDDYLNY